MGCATTHFFFGPTPWCPGEGPKGQISLNIIKIQLQRFLNQTLCVFSQMKDIKHIRRIFIWPSGSCPRGGTWGYCGGLGRSKKKFPKFNQILCVSYLHEWHMKSTIFLGPHPLGLGEGPKGRISLNLNYKVNFKDI